MSTVKNTQTYGRLQRDGEHWLMTEVKPHVVIRLKRHFPRLAVYTSKSFRFPQTADMSADLSWFLMRYPMVMTTADRRALKGQERTYLKTQAEAEAILLPDHSRTEYQGFVDGEALRDYQVVALDYLSIVQRLVLVDEMGLGKTYTGLGVSLMEGKSPTVIVMEPHLQKQWMKKAKSFITGRIHAVKGNTPYSLPDAEVYLFKYTQLAPWCDVLSRGWVKSIVFDEVQQLRTGLDSAKGIAAQTICQSVDIVMGMTGTLIYNYGIECWNIFNIINPGLLGNEMEFMREWCDTDKGRVRDPDALGEYLREAQAILRRTRKDVGQEAKQKAPEKIKVPPNTKSVGDLEALSKTLAMRLTSQDYMNDRLQVAGDFDRTMRKMTGVAKAYETAAFVRMLLEEGTPVLLCGYHHDVYDIWAKLLAEYKPAWYTGRESPTQKERNKQRFLDGETDLFIMSTRTGAGVDELQHRCRTVVFGELDWSPSIHEQVIRRLDRDGQLNYVYVYYMYTEFGSDPSIMDVLGVKDDQRRGIEDPGMKPNALMQPQAEEGRVRKMAEQFLNAKGLVDFKPDVQEHQGVLSLTELGEGL